MTPICSLRRRKCDARSGIASAQRKTVTRNSLCNSKQVVPVHTLVLPDLIIGANTARVDHNAALWICLGVEEVVALGAEMERGLKDD